MTESNYLFQQLEVSLNLFMNEKGIVLGEYRHILNDIKRCCKAGESWPTLRKEVQKQIDKNLGLAHENERLKEELEQTEARKKDAETYWDTLRQEVQGHIDKIIELQTEVSLLKARRWAETDKAYKSGYEKGRSQEKPKEPEWYDAEKCFPFFNKYVVLKVMRDDGTIGQVSNVSLQIRGIAQWIAEDNQGYESYILGKVLKWRYADE